MNRFITIAFFVAVFTSFVASMQSAAEDEDDTKKLNDTAAFENAEFKITPCVDPELINKGENVGTEHIKARKLAEDPNTVNTSIPGALVFRFTVRIPVRVKGAEVRRLALTFGNDDVRDLVSVVWENPVSGFKYTNTTRDLYFGNYLFKEDVKTLLDFSKTVIVDTFSSPKVVQFLKDNNLEYYTKIYNDFDGEGGTVTKGNFVQFLVIAFPQK